MSAIFLLGSGCSTAVEPTPQEQKLERLWVWIPQHAGFFLLSLPFWPHKKSVECPLSGCAMMCTSNNCVVNYKKVFLAVLLGRNKLNACTEWNFKKSSVFKLSWPSNCHLPVGDTPAVTKMVISNISQSLFIQKSWGATGSLWVLNYQDKELTNNYESNRFIP